MKIQIESASIEKGRLVIMATKETRYRLGGLVSEVAKSKTPYEAEFKKLRKKRSLDSNSMAWSLISKIAIAINSTNDEVYLKFIKSCSPSQLVKVRSDAVPMLIKTCKYYEIESEVKQKDVMYSFVKVYAGSSFFDTKEMGKFIDEIILECKLLDIETMPQAEIDRMVKQWDN